MRKSWLCLHLNVLMDLQSIYLNVLYNNNRTLHDKPYSSQLMSDTFVLFFIL